MHATFFARHVFVFTSYIVTKAATFITPTQPQFNRQKEYTMAEQSRNEDDAGLGYALTEWSRKESDGEV